MTDIQTMGRGMKFMIGCFITALTWAMLGGMLLDRMLIGLIDAGLTGGAGTRWDTTGSINVLINLNYMIPLIISGVGVAVYLRSLTRRNRIESMEYSSEWK